MAIRDDENDKLGFEESVPTEGQFASLGDLMLPLKLIKAAIDRLLGDERPTIHMDVFHLLNIGSLNASFNFMTSSRTSRMFVEVFEAKLKLMIPNYGRAIRECHLHPTFKGSLLHYQSDLC